MQITSKRNGFATVPRVPISLGPLHHALGRAGVAREWRFGWWPSRSAAPHRTAKERAPAKVASNPTGLPGRPPYATRTAVGRPTPPVWSVHWNKSPGYVPSEHSGPGITGGAPVRFDGAQGFFSDFATRTSRREPLGRPPARYPRAKGHFDHSFPPSSMSVAKD
jgi:hypothetical protein